MKLEEQLKNTFDHFEPEVDPSVWAKVSARLPSPAPVADPVSSPASGIVKTLVAKLAPFAGWIAAAAAIVGIGIVYKLSSREVAVPVPSATTEIINTKTADATSEKPSENMANQPSAFENSAEDKATINSGKARNTTTSSKKIVSSSSLSSSPINEKKSPVEDNSSLANADKNIISSAEKNPQTLTTKVQDHTDKNISPAVNPVSEQLTKSSAETIAEPVLIINTKGGFAPLTVSVLTNQNGKNADFDFGDGNQTKNVPSASHRYDESGTYSISCTVSGKELSASVEVLGKLPSVFSPNGDGINDQLIFSSPEVIFVDVNIYDRAGRKVLSAKGKQVSWDGSISGAGPAQTGTYFYDIFATSVSGITYKQKGTINLFR